MSLINSSWLLHQCPTGLVHLTWMIVRWVIGGHTAIILWSVASRICSKQHAASLYHAYLIFSQSVWFKIKWFNHTIVWIWIQLIRIPIWFYRGDLLLMWSLITNDKANLTKIFPSPTKKKKISSNKMFLSNFGLVLFYVRKALDWNCGPKYLWYKKNLENIKLTE